MHANYSELKRSPTRSKSKAEIPKVRLENIKEPDRLIVDPEKSRFWVSDHREGQEISFGSTQTISEFVGEVEPVKWSCRQSIKRIFSETKNYTRTGTFISCQIHQG